MEPRSFVVNPSAKRYHYNPPWEECNTDDAGLDKVVLTRKQLKDLPNCAKSARPNLADTLRVQGGAAPERTGLTFSLTPSPFMGDAWTIPFESKTHSTLGMSS